MLPLTSLNEKIDLIQSPAAAALGLPSLPQVEELSTVIAFLKMLNKLTRSLSGTINFTMQYKRKLRPYTSTTLNLRTEKDNEKDLGKFLLSGRIDHVNSMFPLSTNFEVEVSEVTLYVPKDLIIQTQMTAYGFSIVKLEPFLFGMNLSLCKNLESTVEKDFLVFNGTGMSKNEIAPSALMESEDLKEVLTLKSSLGLKLGEENDYRF